MPSFKDHRHYEDHSVAGRWKDGWEVDDVASIFEDTTKKNASLYSHQFTIVAELAESSLSVHA